MHLALRGWVSGTYLTHTRSRLLACHQYRVPRDHQVQFLQGAEGGTKAQRGDKTCHLVAELETGFQDLIIKPCSVTLWVGQTFQAPGFSQQTGMKL